MPFYIYENLIESGPLNLSRYKARQVALHIALSAALLVGGGMNAFAGTVLVQVPGTSDPWLAGMPPGSIASGDDTAPAQSPVLVRGIHLAKGVVLTFSASGGVLNRGGCPPECRGPDGGQQFWSHQTNPGPENGISDITTRDNSLLGVFLDDLVPADSPAPEALSFENEKSPELAPKLRQVFLIGSGRLGNALRRIHVPSGATRLYLGTMDGFTWSDNTGAFAVNVADDGSLPDLPAPTPTGRGHGATPSDGRISIRTENYARPPYSGATYYFYEKDSQVICTKLETCNKFGQCSSDYWHGYFKEPDDTTEGEPFNATAPVVIPLNKLAKHICLTKFRLLGQGK